MNISTKTKWVRTDAWRGYSQPINAVGGANNTGSWEDSPCPAHICKAEIDGFKSILRKNKIRHKVHVGQTSNVFCIHVYVLVANEDRSKALELAKDYERNNTRLFYAVND